MRLLHSRLVWICAALCMMSIVYVTLLPRRAPPNPASWLATSRPLISFAHSSTGVIAQVAFDVTNSSPRPLEVFAVWYEARDGAGRRVVWPQFHANAETFSLPLPALPRFVLPAGDSTNVQWCVGLAGNTNEAWSVCASLGCVEIEPPMTTAFREAPLDRLAAGVDRIYEFSDVPWRWQPRGGKVFVSNARVAEFFQQYYGWAPDTWPGLEVALMLVERPLNDPTCVTGQEIQDWSNASAAASFAAMEFDDFCGINMNNNQDAEQIASHEPPPRASVSDAPDARTLDPLPAPLSGGGR